MITISRGRVALACVAECDRARPIRASMTGVN
jgi:hypothetical protein